MTDIEQKALALVRKEDGHGYLNYDAALAALCRAIEQHEATKQELSDYKQKVSDAIEGYLNSNYCLPREPISRFIIPAPKPDPLVQAMEEVDICAYAEIKAEYADRLRADLVDRFRAALDARGLQIVEKNDDQ